MLVPVALADRALLIRVLATATLAAGLVLVAGLAGVCPPLVAAAGAAGVAAAVPAAALVWRGLTIRAAARQLPELRGSCRCSGMLGLGALASAVTAVVLPMVGASARPGVATVGLAVAAVLFMLGLLYVPGVAASPASRLRQGLDGLIIGVSLALVGWILAPDLGAEYPLAYVAAAVAASCAAITVAIVLGTARLWPTTARCGGGAMLAVVGLAMLVVTVGRDTPQWVLLAAAALMVAGAPLIAVGAWRVDPIPPPARPVSVEEIFNGYPMLALPGGVVVLAFAYHLIAIGQPDRTAVLLGLAVGAMLTIREVPAAAEQRRSARQLAAQEAHLRALVAGAGDVTMVLRENLVVQWQSPAAGQQLGLTDRQVVGRRFTDLIHPDDVATVADRFRAVTAGLVRSPLMVGASPAAGSGPALDPTEPVLLEARLTDGHGGWRETESTVSDLRGVPAVGALVVQVRDVGQRRALERTLHRLTSCDQLTGLPNRRELVRAITARRGAGHRSGALLVIDLGGFCAVNDQHGRAAGDALLVAVAQRLQELVGPESVVSRLGERQFAVLTADGPIEAYALGFRVLAELSRPYPLPGGQVQLVASVGVSALAGGVHADEVVRRGDLALRRASQLGQARIEWYDESIEEQLVRRLDLERHLPGAAGRGELALVYQPVVELDSGRPVGVEALLRWRHPVLGVVYPGELLPVADKLRLSAEIGEWVLHEACQQVGAWRRAGHDLWLAINASTRQLAAPDFVAEVAAALSVHQTPPERLTIEVAEAEIGDQLPTVAGRLSRLRSLGVRTGLDDFGTGLTDLARLRRLPLDVVKLSPPAGAGSVAANPVVPVPDLAEGLAAAVLEVAGRLGLTVIAEGLETPAQRDLLWRAGCRYGQGRLVASPAPAPQIEAYLAHCGSTIG